ncbi:MAG: cyclase family protein [Phycisphaerae bacterium]|jgi:kynurenine formamidase
MINISRLLKENGIVYPGDPSFKIVEQQIAGYEGTKLRSAYQIFLTKNHHGTHIDFPAHKIPSGKTSDFFPLDYFINMAVLLDKRDNKPLNYSTVTEKVGAVIIYTGDNMGYLTKEETNNLKNFKTLRMVGTDSLTIDKRGANGASHRILLEKDILILEGLCNLEKVLETYGTGQFMLYAAPVAIQNTDGAPVRAFVGEAK